MAKIELGNDFFRRVKVIKLMFLTAIIGLSVLTAPVSSQANEISESKNKICTMQKQLEEQAEMIEIMKERLSELESEERKGVMTEVQKL